MRSPFSDILLAIALCAIAAGSARAQEPPDGYEQAYRRGTELFQQESYEAARAEFEKAYAIHPEPLLLLNIGSTYRREQNLDRALDYYQRFLREALPDDEYRPAAEAVVAELENEIAERDRREAEQRPPAPPPEPAPVVAPPPPVRDAPPQRDGRALRLTGIATAAVGAVLVGIGVQQGLHARSIDDELSEATGPWTPERQQRYDDGEAAETRAIVLGVTGGLAIATGATLYFLGRRNHGGQERDGVAIAPYADGATTGFALSGTF